MKRIFIPFLICKSSKFSFKMSLFLPKDVGTLFTLSRRMSTFDSETLTFLLGGQTSIRLQCFLAITLSPYSALGDA